LVVALGLLLIRPEHSEAGEKIYWTVTNAEVTTFSVQRANL